MQDEDVALEMCGVRFNRSPIRDSGWLSQSALWGSQRIFWNDSSAIFWKDAICVPLDTWTAQMTGVEGCVRPLPITHPLFSAALGEISITTNPRMKQWLCFPDILCWAPVNGHTGKVLCSVSFPSHLAVACRANCSLVLYWRLGIHFLALWWLLRCTSNTVGNKKAWKKLKCVSTLKRDPVKMISWGSMLTVSAWFLYQMSSVFK